MFDLRPVLLLLAALLYGLIGSPTPDGIGWREMIIGLAFMAAIGPAIAFRNATARQEQPWGMAAQGLLLYGLTVPLVVGLVQGNDPGNMLRDLIPFLFLLLPLFMQDWRQRTERVQYYIPAAAIMIGLFFGLRVLWPALQGGKAEDDLYLAIAPTVVFTAVFLAAKAGEYVYRGVTLRHLAGSVLLLGGSCLAFSGLVLTLQRASLVLAVFGLVILLILAFCHRPTRALAPLCLAVIACLLLAPLLNEVAMALHHKQEMVGTNMRLQEAAAVLDKVGQTGWSVLLGQGWGATFASPAVGGVDVNFTHNLLTSYWLKTGLLGIVLLCTYIVRLGVGWFGIIRKKPVLAVALAVPLVIDMVLYASFKSLDFGLILVILAVFAPERVRLRSAAS